MTSSEFINKFKSKYLWGNIGAMILVLVLLCAGVKYGIDCPCSIIHVVQLLSQWNP